MWCCQPNQIEPPQVNYEKMASLLPKLSDWAVLMCLYTITTKYDETLEAAHAHIDENVLGNNNIEPCTY